MTVLFSSVVSVLFLSRCHLQRVFEWREKPSLWCRADVVTCSVVGEWWLQSCRFLVPCVVKRSMRRVRDHWFVFLAGYVAGWLCLQSRRPSMGWLPEASCRGSHDASRVVPPTGCGVTAVSQSRPRLPCASCAHQSSVQGPAQTLTMNSKIAVTSEKKTHGLKMQMLVNGHSVRLETLVAATTHKRTFHQADVNMQRVLTPKCVFDIVSRRLVISV